jgi:hypothetical protein
MRMYPPPQKKASIRRKPVLMSFHPPRTPILPDLGLKAAAAILHFDTVFKVILCVLLSTILFSVHL